MNIAIVCVLLVIGLVLIIKGGDYFVDSAAWIAETLGVPQFIVGATIVSFATTLPEVIVSVIAAIDGHNLLLAGDTVAALGQVEMSIGNAVGSVTANTGLIMGIALIFAPCMLARKDFAVKAVLLLLSIVLLYVLCLGGGLNMWLGLILFIPLIAFFVENVISAKRLMSVDANTLASEDKRTKQKPPFRVVLFNILRFGTGLFCIVLGARLLVDYGTELANIFGLSEGIIAVTIVAVGTSLPELITMITSVVKKRGAMSIGNIIGANIIDITLILPICALIYGGTLPVAAASLSFDLPFCLGIAAVALLPSVFTKKFDRWQGLIMLAAYITYIALRIVFM